MRSNDKQANVNFGQYLYDTLTIIASYKLAYDIASMLTNLYKFDMYMWILIVYIPIWLFTMTSLGMYNITTFKYYDRLLRNILFSSFVSGMISAAMIFFVKETLFSRIFYASFLVSSILLLIAQRFIYTFFILKHTKVGAMNMVIIGDKALSDKLVYYLKKTDILTNIVGYFPIDSLNKLDMILKEKPVDEVIFAVPKEYIKLIEEHALACEEMGVTVSMVLDFYDFKISRVYFRNIGTIPMLTFHTVSFNKPQLYIKRVIDIIGSIVGLIITGLLSIFIIPAIKLDSPGPILFKQNRVGINGRLFKLYKFRSMVVDAEDKKNELLSQNQVNGDLMFKMKNDPRITRIGKFLRATSLDEFPQFINVLKGDMSLVGTRPPTVDEVGKYENHHRRRISIKPGITGMWQVNGRSQITDFDKVVALDTQYIDNWSVWLDIKIMLQTFITLFTRKGAM